MDIYKIISENSEKEINKGCSKKFLIVSLFLFIIYILNKIGIFQTSQEKINICVILNVIFLSIPMIFIYLFHKNGTYMKYVITTMSVFVVSVLYLTLNYHVLLIMTFPFFIACLYFDKKLFIYTFIIDIISLICVHICEILFATIPTAPLKTPYEILVWGLLPRLIESLCVFYVCYKVIDRNKELLGSSKILLNKNINLQKDIIYQFATVCENSSEQTGHHIRRTSEYMKVLVSAAGYDEETSEKVAIASMMHDIGKMKIPIEILEKKSKLSDNEFEVIKKHVLHGNDLLNNTDSEIIKLARIIALQHHERWDGTGYLGLKGEEINIFARMMSVVDVYDALVSKRCYKEKWHHQDAFNEILRCSGTQFDSDIVNLFIRNYDKILNIYHKYSE